MIKPYRNRSEAGRVLAGLVERRVEPSQAVVLGLPRGGIPVGYEVALVLKAPLDVIPVRKLGVPGQEELAFGALATRGVRVLNLKLIEQVGLDAAEMDAITNREQRELERREARYREGRAVAEVQDRTAVVTDDGLATGATMSAAVEAVRILGARRVVVAVPVGVGEICRRLREKADEVICAAVPEPFGAVGQWYLDFSPTSDEDVCKLLREGSRRHRSGDEGDHDPDAPKMRETHPTN